MNALLFLVHAVFSMAFFIFWLRLMLRYLRVPGFDPFARGIYQLTDRLVQPLRKVLQDIGRIEVATLLVLLILSYLAVRTPNWLAPCVSLEPILWVYLAGRYLLSQVLQLYGFFMLAYVLMSWVNPTSQHSVQRLLRGLCQPLLKPVRAVLPPIGGIDFSPIVPLLLIGALSRQFGIQPPCL